MKILIADKLAPEGPAYLQGQSGVEVTVNAGLGEDDLVQCLREHDGVVVRSAVQLTGPILDRVMDTGPGRLRGIARAGVGVDNIDLPAATKYGIAVMNSASASTITTAEHAFALMIGLARNIGPACRTMADGRWDRSSFVGSQLHGRTLGVVGFGRIGQTLASRALAFGMKVIAHDPFVNATSGLDGQVPMVNSFDELISQVDIVSFHVPKTETTSGMLGAEQFAAARPGLLVINAARGGIVDTDAMLQALDAGQCGGAAVDVYESEPPAADDPLRTHPKVLCTPHLGASTVEAQEAVAVNACKALLRYLQGHGLDGAVNAGGLNLDMTDRQRAFSDLAGRMVALLRATSDDSAMRAVRVTVRGNGIAAKADTITRYALMHLLSHHLEAPVSVINAALIAEERGIAVETVIASDQGEDRLAIDVTHGERTRTVHGAIYEDGRPRVTNLDGYAMDMVAEGEIVLLTNADLPGRIGLVGQIVGDAGLNIAEMVIGRGPGGPGEVAMMILTLDDAPGDDLLQTLRDAEGILHVGAVRL